MSDLQIDLISLWRYIYKFKKEVFKWSLIGCLLGGLIAFSIPNEYMTIVRMVPDTPSENGNNGLQAAAAMIGVDMGNNVSSGISYNVYPEVIQSNAFLYQFKDLLLPDGVTMLSVYFSDSTKSPWWINVISLPRIIISTVTNIFKDTEVSIGNAPKSQISYANYSKQDYAFISTFRDRISVNLDSKSGILSLGVTMQDPSISAFVANELLMKLKEYIIKFRTQKAQNSLNTTRAQYEEAKEKYYIIDSLYAEEVDKNQRLLTNKSRLKVERLENERNLYYTLYQHVSSKLNADVIKLQDDTPTVIIIEPASTPMSPVRPNKTMIILGMTIVFAFGYIIKCAIGYLKESSIGNAI